MDSSGLIVALQNEYDLSTEIRVSKLCLHRDVSLFHLGSIISGICEVDWDSVAKSCGVR